MTLPQGASLAPDVAGKYLLLVPGVSGMTSNRVYEVPEATVQQYGWTAQGLTNDAIRQSVGSIDASGFDLNQVLSSYNANLQNLSTINQQNAIAAAHPYDTNYSSTELSAMGLAKDASGNLTSTNPAAPLTADNRGLGDFTGVTNPNGTGVQVNPQNTVQAQAQNIQPAQIPQQSQGVQMPKFYQPDASNPQIYDANNNRLTYEQYKAMGGQGTLGQGAFGDVIQGSPQSGQGLNFQQGQSSNEASPPQYDQQGMLIPGTGGLKEQVDNQQSQSGSVLTANNIDPNNVIQEGKIQNPYQTFTNTYAEIFKQLGIADVKTQLADFNQQYSDLENKKNDEIQKINDDPWLTEGMRLKRIESINNRYEGKEKILTGKISNMQKIYDDGIEQAKFVAGTAVTLAHNQAVLDQNLLLKKMDLAERAYEYENTLALNTQKSNQTSDITEYEYAKSQGYSGSLVDFQREMANLKAKANGSGLGGLFNAAQINATVNQIAGAFDNEPIVKNYNIISEGYQFAKSLVNKANPTSSDDQGLIYAFAKAMDPNSVVREGEYATVQKYAQSWAQSFGFNAQRIFSNQPFLSQQARQNMVNTIESKYSASQKNYQNVYNQYQQRINSALSGQGNTLTDYSKAFSTSGTNTSNLPDISTFNFQLGQ